MKPNAILWDMDGVLVDTGEYHYQSWATVMPDYDLAFSRQFFSDTFGMNNAGVLGTLLGDDLTPDLLAEISDRKEEAFREAVRGNVKPLPGVLDWLRLLKEQGFRQGVASSAPPANIDALVGELGLAAYFDVVVSGNELPGKPEPLLFLKVAHLLDVPAARCVVVEDAVAGVEAARRAGMKCIAVTTTNPSQALQAADLVVDSLTNLEDGAFQGLLNL
jgi:HAD superfamily hydrolase (TIGR01509 family)